MPSGMLWGAMLHVGLVRSCWILATNFCPGKELCQECAGCPGDAWWFTPDDQHQRISKVVRGSSDPDFSGLADHH